MSQNHTERVYRVDKFIVPNPARVEFLERVQQTHRLLKMQPGFIQDFILESPNDSDSFKLMTMVEWENPDVIQLAKVAVKSMQAQDKFNPQELMSRLGIEAEIGSYSHIQI